MAFKGVHWQPLNVNLTYISIKSRPMTDNYNILSETNQSTVEPCYKRPDIVYEISIKHSCAFLS